MHTSDNSPWEIEPGEVHPSEEGWGEKLREIRAARKRAAMRNRSLGLRVDGAWHYRDRRIQGWGVAALFLGLMLGIAGLLLYVIFNWPQGQY